MSHSQHRRILSRSHLMHQFLDTARSQRRPPLPLLMTGTCYEHDATERARCECNTGSLSSLSINRSSLKQKKWLPSLDSPSRTFSVQSIPPMTRQSTPSALHPHHQRRDQDSRKLTNYSGAQDDADIASPASITQAASFFQSKLQSRRTHGNFQARPGFDYQAAITRAVTCARTAPNHKRTEPFTFYSMLRGEYDNGPIARLADICYHVNVRVQHAKQSQRGATNDAAAQLVGQKKRDKWASIPAYLATTVATRRDESVIVPNEMEPSLDRNDAYWYDPLPPVPLLLTRDLEDYAAACAATQNLLLSLHSESVASKWATGAVVETRAFRDLLQLSSSERVVALIMIGHDDSDLIPRRFRRELQDDVLRIVE